MKIGVRIVTHTRYVALQMIEVAATRESFQGILPLIDGLRTGPRVRHLGKSDDLDCSRHPKNVSRYPQKGRARGADARPTSHHRSQAELKAPITISLPRGAGEGRGTACCGQRVVLSDGGDELPVRSMTACI